MRQPSSFVKKFTLCLLVLGALSGCNALVDTSNAAASVTKQAFSDAASTWGDVFTYTGTAKPQLPQTRYCYRMMSDIVCYDSLQPTLTAQLIGYQDGNSMSWIQPGGGSLGASGAPAIALQAGPVNDTAVLAVNDPVSKKALESASDRNGEILTYDLPVNR